MTVEIVEENETDNTRRHSSLLISIRLMGEDDVRLSYSQKTQGQNTNQHQLLSPLHLQAIYDPGG